MNDDKKLRSSKFREQMIAKWRDQLKRVEVEIVTLHHSRSIYRRLFKIVDANPRIQKPNALYEWLHLSYVTYASTAIRRLIDDHKDAVSLSNLVRSMSANESVITRKWFVSRYTEPLCKTDYPSRDFDNLVGVGRSTVEGGDLKRRLDQIRSLSSRVVDYVDKLVAHTDRKLPDKLPTYGDLDKAIDAVGELFEHLHLLINQASLLSLEPVETFPWERLFEEPWIVRSRRPD